MSAVIWNSGAPPKRGVYRVRCDGPNPNAGYRYWYGDGWSNLTCRHARAQELKDRTKNRNTPLKRAVLWASKGQA